MAAKLKGLRIWPRFVTVAFSNSEMVYLSRSGHNGVPPQVICIQNGLEKRRPCDI